VILRLAHVEVGVADLDRSHEFYVDVLGFQEHQRADDAIYLRGAHEFDVFSLKLTRAPGAGVCSIGFRVGSPDDLDELAGLHERLGLRHAALPEGFHPGRGPGLRVCAPSGHVLDFHHHIDEVGLYDDDGLAVPPMRRRGANDGSPPSEIDHVNLRVPELEAAIAYFHRDLDFSISEIALNPDGERFGVWMRRTRTTHDVAVLENEIIGLHHFAYAIADGATLIRAADLLSDAGFADNIQFGPGRHGATNALAMYFLDPDGNRIEFYSGDYHRDLDREPIVWSHEDFWKRGRFWWGRPPVDNFPIPAPILDTPWPQTVAL
jgi:catechol 2,3-dioxygenase